MRLSFYNSQVTAINFAALMAIFLLPVIAVLGFMDIAYYLRWDDNDIGWFGFGISWLSGIPRVNFHHPSLFFNILSGVISLGVHVDGTEKALLKFLKLGFWVHISGTVLILAYASWVAKQIRMPFMMLITMGVLTALMPVTVIFVTSYGNYYFMNLLALPTTMLLYGWYKGEAKCLVPLFGLSGFLAVNYYPSLMLTLILIASIVFLSLVKTKTSLNFKNAHQLVKSHKWFSVSLFFTIIIPTIVLTVAIIIGKIKFSILSAVVAPSILVLLSVFAPFLILSINSAISDELPDFLKAIKALLFGWWVGGLVLVPFYLTSLFRAHQGNENDFLDSLKRFAQVIIDIPWLWAATIIIVAWFISAIFHFKRKNIHIAVSQLFFVAGAIISLLIISLPFHSADMGLPGRGLRIMIPILIPILLCFSISYDVLHKGIRNGLSILIVTICCYGLIQVVEAGNLFIQKQKPLAEKIDGAIEDFYDKNKDGIVVCARDEVRSKVCSAAYAYNRYHSKGGRRNKNTRYLFDGQVIWLSFKEMKQPITSYLKNPSQPTLIVGKSSVLMRTQNQEIENAEIILKVGEFSVKKIN